MNERHRLFENGDVLAIIPNRFLGLHVATIMWGDRLTRDYDGDFRADCANGAYNLALHDHTGLIVWHNGKIIR